MDQRITLSRSEYQHIRDGYISVDVSVIFDELIKHGVTCERCDALDRSCPFHITHADEMVCSRWRKQ